jgi:hypothetical protein
MLEEKQMRKSWKIRSRKKRITSRKGIEKSGREEQLGR